jgi:Na+-transporting methylmalonyl-CoA/oxaloacetate decarboxylase gamma subunit
MLNCKFLNQFSTAVLFFIWLGVVFSVLIILNCFLDKIKKED